MVEHWIALDGNPRYSVSNLGQIYDHERGRLLGQSQDRAGYLRVKLWIDDERKTISVHRIVANAFFAVDLFNYEVNHIDNNKQNNNIRNLEVCNRSENMLHAFENDYATPVFKPLKVRIRETGEVFDSTGQADRHLGVSSGSVSKTLRGLQPTVKGYTFELA